MTLRHRICILASLLIGFVLYDNSPVAATTVYAYTGNNFTTYDDPALYKPPNISGSFSLANSLQPNLTNHDISFDILSLFFSDGVNTPIEFCCSPTVVTYPLESWSIVVGTDALGNINAWNITVQGTSPTRDLLFLTQSGFLIPSEDFANSSGFGFGTETGNPGEWATTVSNPTTPLPAALPLLATGLGALGLLGWRRKRKAAGDSLNKQSDLFSYQGAFR